MWRGGSTWEHGAWKFSGCFVEYPEPEWGTQLLWFTPKVLQPHTAHYPTVGLVSLLSLVLSGSVRILEEKGVHKKLGGGTNRRLNLAKEIFHTLRHHAQIISWGQSGQDTLLRSCLSIWLRAIALYITVRETFMSDHTGIFVTFTLTQRELGPKTFYRE